MLDSGNATEASPPARPWTGPVARAIHAEPRELKAVLLAFFYFFFLLSGYYILRPLRDEMGVAGGVKQLEWLFWATFGATLLAVPAFSALAARLPRHRFIPLSYRFFTANILVFWALFESGRFHVGAARAFFIWLSVYNLFVVSVFWSFMADIFRHEQGARLRWALARESGPTPRAAAQEQALGGNFLSGIPVVFRSTFLLGICAYVLLLTVTTTFLYFEQAQIVLRASDDPRVRTALFARIDLVVNVLTLVLQGFVTGRLLRAFGVRVGLALLPVLTVLGFVALVLSPTLLVLTVVQGIRRAAHFSIDRPSREILFIDVPREQKYKSKNFIDTVVYRGGDAVAARISTVLQALGLGILPTAAAAILLSGVWLWNALVLARKDEAMETSR